MYILLDIGGTKTRIARSDNLVEFGTPSILETPQNFDDGITLIRDEVKRIVGGDTLEAVAVGIAASPNREKTEILGGGPNITDWLGKPLKERLEGALDAPVSIENDTVMGGLAQIVYGPAKGKEIVVYMTVSTGVGGCRFVGGKPDPSAMGFEPGWQIIAAPQLNPQADETWCNGYCSSGYLMSHIGGVCVEKAEGKKPYEITDDAFWDNKAKLLAAGLHNVCTMWSPDMIVIGGSMMNEIGIPIDKTKEYLSATLKDVFQTIPEIVHAEFGDEMGIHGAMAYLQTIKKTPL